MRGGMLKELVIASYLLRRPSIIKLSLEEKRRPYVEITAVFPAATL
jgi:hypothetical protein